MQKYEQVSGHKAQGNLKRENILAGREALHAARPKRGAPCKGRDENGDGGGKQAIEVLA